MRAARFAIFLTSLLASLGTATPLTKEHSTAITVDQDSQLVTTGELVVHVIRTDDLLSDYTAAHERSLILERLTHVVLRVQLDRDAQALSINDARLSLAPHAAVDDRVKVVKGEALMLPKGEMDVEGKHLDAPGLAALADKMLPPGIVAAKVSVEEEAAAPMAIVGLGGEGENAVVSMKSFQVSLKIVEIDSQSIAHEVSLVVPVLKVQLSYQADGKPVEMKAFAIRPVDGRKAIEQKHLVGADENTGEHHRHHWDSEKDDERDVPHHRRPSHDWRHHHEHDENEMPHRHPHHPWHHGPPHPPPPFIRWIADLLGYKPPPPRHHWRHHRPHFEGDANEGPFPYRHNSHHAEGENDEMMPRYRVGKAGAGAIKVDSNGQMEQITGMREAVPHHGPHRVVEGGRPFGRRPWRHAHQRFRHRRLACRLRHFARRHSETIFVVAFAVKLVLFSALAFVLVRRVRKAVRARRERTEGAIRLPEEDAAVDGDEKEVEIVVEKS